MNEQELLLAIRGVIKEEVSSVIHQEVQPQFDLINGRLDSMEGRLDSMEGRLDSMEGRLDRIESDVAVLKSDMVEVKGKVEAIAEWVDDIDQEVVRLKILK